MTKTSVIQKIIGVFFCFIGNSAEFPMKQNAPQGCAPRGDEVYASHTARARRMRKAHSFL